jgi:hypothetical protein
VNKQGGAAQGFEWSVNVTRCPHPGGITHSRVGGSCGPAVRVPERLGEAFTYARTMSSTTLMVWARRTTAPSPASSWNRGTCLLARARMTARSQEGINGHTET